MRTNGRVALLWGRSDPDYSRNRILRGALQAAGWTVVEFRPRSRKLAYLEARLRRLGRPDLVWVPCFRHRDIPAAARYARRRAVPLLFDPLISFWEKEVFEEKSFMPDSEEGERLLAWERRLFRAADLVLADTEEHARFYAETFGSPGDRLAVVPVGAEEPLFHAAPMPARDGRPLEVLFYGSFLGLHGLECIVEAARLYQGPPVIWTMLGEGPLQSDCGRRAEGLANVAFEPWIPYADLPARIHRADILLGVFGASAKAGRVIPNKVYQALASGRPLITREADVYPGELQAEVDSGIIWVPPADPSALAAAVASQAAAPERLDTLAAAAAHSYEKYFSNDTVHAALGVALNRIIS